MSDSEKYHFHIPKKYEKMKTCLDFTELSGLKYTLEIIEDRIINQKRVTYGEVSNSIYITEQKSFKTDSPLGEALWEVVEKFMMIKKFREFESPIITNKYDKLSILKLITDRAREKEIQNYVDHKHHEGIAKKQIDMALIDKDGNPYAIATMASIYKDAFDDNLITSIFTLQEAMRKEVVKDQFLYIPIMKNERTLKHNKALGWAKEQAQHINVDMITDSSQDAVLERLNQYKPPKEQLELENTL